MDEENTFAYFSLEIDENSSLPPPKRDSAQRLDPFPSTAETFLDCLCRKKGNRTRVSATKRLKVVYATVLEELEQNSYFAATETEEPLNTAKKLLFSPGFFGYTIGGFLQRNFYIMLTMAAAVEESVYKNQTTATVSLSWFISTLLALNSKIYDKKHIECIKNLCYNIAMAYNLKIFENHKQLTRKTYNPIPGANDSQISGEQHKSTLVKTEFSVKGARVQKKSQKGKTQSFFNVMKKSNDVLVIEDGNAFHLEAQFIDKRVNVLEQLRGKGQIPDDLQLDIDRITDALGNRNVNTLDELADFLWFTYNELVESARAQHTIGEEDDYSLKPDDVVVSWFKVVPEYLLLLKKSCPERYKKTELLNV
eukprot:snap_masked-scaffold_66-processed-gene-0.57-mRNA-1 protein AED:1.00 eAED:1.00 QI:0/-1/0/0/-1/1/1/0/364